MLVTLKTLCHYVHGLEKYFRRTKKVREVTVRNKEQAYGPMFSCRNPIYKYLGVCLLYFQVLEGYMK